MKIAVKVTAGAKRESIKKIDDNNFRISVTVVPEKGRANEKVIKLLSKYLDVPKTSLVIIKGQNSNHKLIELTI